MNAEEMVEVTLDQDRMYRANHTDRAAITVKKGTAFVPRWVAEEWEKPTPFQTAQDDASLFKAEIARLTAELEKAKQPSTPQPPATVDTGQAVIGAGQAEKLPPTQHKSFSKR